MQPLTPYPAIVRDVALLVDRALPQAEIRRRILENAPTELEKVELFDVFEGKGVPAGKKSLAFSIRYRAADRTLTDQDVNGYHDNIKEALRTGLGAEIREG
jgi:phenylalanyl-tRNA synthetase beta chain